jgi:hypothetical protein
VVPMASAVSVPIAGTRTRLRRRMSVFMGLSLSLAVLMNSACREVAEGFLNVPEGLFRRAGAR